MISYSYDSLNRLSSLAPPSAFGSGSFGFSYDALSRRTQMTRPNGVTTNYTYDNLSRLLSVLHQAGGSTIDGASYTVDAAGNRSSKTDQLAGVTTNYSYDAIYQLVQAAQGGTTTESYSYDPVGNRLSSLGVSPYSNNSSNELISTPSALFAFDDNGNTTSKTDPTGTTSYAWDFEHRLASVTLPASGGTVTFKYDPFGRRIEKTSPTTTSIFAYDGNNLTETVNASGSAVARYAQRTDVDETLAMQRGSTTSFYEADALGSVTSLSNGVGGLIQTYTYDSFGNTTNSSGPLTNFFRYTGREFDTETNLYYNRARYLDPTTGRFISEDPIAFDGGVDFYSYSRNSPVDYADPFGLFTVDRQIPIIRAPDVDFACGSNNGGACTTGLRASVKCDCNCDGKEWKAKAKLIVKGTMYVANFWPYKRGPIDKSVYDGQSAINHENNVHINPAINGVSYVLNNLESKTFNSQADCQAACKKASDFVGKLFGAILTSTQNAESNGK